MYLNTSGNVRDGQAFVLVKRDDREYHIYGTGKDRSLQPQGADREDGDRDDDRRRRRHAGHDDDRHARPTTGTSLVDNVS